MNHEPHIVLFYSYGPHFLRTARALRADYVNSRITAIIPGDFPQQLLKDLAIHGLPLLPNPSQTRSLRNAAATIKRLRNLCPDILVVLFDSPKLRLLAALSTAKERYCYHVDGRVTPVKRTFTIALAHTLAHRVYGRIRYIRIWCHVHFTRVQQQDRTENPLSKIDRTRIPHDKDI